MIYVYIYQHYLWNDAPGPHRGVDSCRAWQLLRRSPQPLRSLAERMRSVIRKTKTLDAHMESARFNCTKFMFLYKINDFIYTINDFIYKTNDFIYKTNEFMHTNGAFRNATRPIP